MSKLVIKRPRDKEKIYDGSKLKVYVNNHFIGKLRQNDTLEIDMEENIFEIQAKSFEYKSVKEKFEINEKIELEITRNDLTRYPLLIILLFPIIFTILYNTETYWMKMLAIALLGIILAWFVYSYFKKRANAIVIRKV